MNVLKVFRDREMKGLKKGKKINERIEGSCRGEKIYLEFRRLKLD